MLKREFIIFLALTAIVLASEAEDNELKKRGASKATALNAIPTGSQKPDYSYNLYPQSSVSSSPSQTYQGQVPSSFYPNQASSQYYIPANNQSPPSPNHAQTPNQPSNFIPINYITNTGYQPKYQIVPQKQIGNVQFTVPSPILQYPHSYFSSNPINHIAQSPLGQGHFGFGPAFQTLPAGVIGHPSMVVLPQSHPNLYNNLVYSNPTQSLYNYPSFSQPKYSYSPSPTSSIDYKAPPVKSLIKEDGAAQNSEYLVPDSNTYKHTYTSRSTYPKK